MIVPRAENASAPQRMLAAALARGRDESEQREPTGHDPGTHSPHGFPPRATRRSALGWRLAKATGYRAIGEAPLAWSRSTSFSNGPLGLIVPDASGSVRCPTRTGPAWTGERL